MLYPVVGGCPVMGIAMRNIPCLAYDLKLHIFTDRGLPTAGRCCPWNEESAAEKADSWEFKP
jgi:hypothetical protein